MRKAFTLIELLVVILLIALLIALVFPAYTAVRRRAIATRADADMQTIAIGLGAYFADFGQFPLADTAPGIVAAADRPNPPTGAQLLCQMLLAPCPASDTTAPANSRLKQDGADGWGFKARVGGRTYGPYLKPESFRLSNAGQPLLMEILDVWGRPIQYAVPSKIGPTRTAYDVRSYIITSSGEDEKLGTSDDLVRP